MSTEYNNKIEHIYYYILNLTEPIPHILHRREQIFRRKHPAKGWVVERTNSWHNRFRKLFTRYEKKDENYLGLVQLANNIIIYRRLIL